MDGVNVRAEEGGEKKRGEEAGAEEEEEAEEEAEEASARHEPERCISTHDSMAAVRMYAPLHLRKKKSVENKNIGSELVAQGVDTRGALFCVHAAHERCFLFALSTRRSARMKTRAAWKTSWMSRRGGGRLGATLACTCTCTSPCIPLPDSATRS